jgi:hypothetical protein
MDHRVSAIDVHHLASSQPVKQFSTVVCLQNGVESVTAMLFAHAGCDREQV